MTTPDERPQNTTPFQQKDELPTAKRQFGSHRNDWWLDIEYSEDIDMNGAIDPKTLRDKLKPKK